MYLTQIRAGVFTGMLLLAMGVAAPLPANAQSMFSFKRRREEIPKVERVQKTSTAFKVSELFLATGTAFDATTTIQGLDHPTTANMSNGNFLAHYYVRETGWAGFLGSRDAFTAVGANVVKNFLIDRCSRRLYARGGRWRTVAFGMDIAQAVVSSIAAGRNIRSDERIDSQVRLATGYRGIIIWSH